MSYTLTVFDKCRPDDFYFFNDKVEFTSFLRDYLNKDWAIEVANELGYGDILMLDFQGLINLIWDTYNSDESDMFHCIVHYDGRKGTMIEKKEDYIIVHNSGSYIEHAELFSLEDFRMKLIKMIEEDDMDVDWPRHSALGKLIQGVYKFFEENPGDDRIKIFKIDLKGNSEEIPYEETK